MRRLIVTTFLTLDGVMQAPGRPEEDPSDGFRTGLEACPVAIDRLLALLGAQSSG
jgi:hypothetical protein